MADTIEFTRGDGNTHTFAIPASVWTAGGKLFFAAKPAIDDDNTDANSQVNGSWNDTAVSDVTIGGVAYKRYTCYFPPSATNSILSNGADELEYLGEFQYVPTSGIPQTYPANNQKLDCIVWPDVKRETA